MIQFEKTRVLFAYCKRTERAKVFFRRTNKEVKDHPEYKFTRMEMTIPDAEGLCLQAEKILAEMEATEDGVSIPSLKPFPLEARVGHQDSRFWGKTLEEKGLIWSSDSGNIRCRPVENAMFEASLVVNSPRSDPNLKNWNGPTLFFPMAGIRHVFGKIRANLIRYNNNSD